MTTKTDQAATPEAILSEVRGFMKSRIILSAAELDFFSLLARAPLSAADVAKRLKLDLRATTRILDCLVIFGLLQKEDLTYVTTPGGRFLASNHPETVLPMVLHFNDLWATWGEMTDILRKGTARDVKAGIKDDGWDWKAFVGAMHVAARGLAGEIAAVYDTTRFSCLLDIGGASGTYAIAFLRKNPGLKAVVFDLPEVIPLAAERLAVEGLSGRAHTVAGDFYEDEFPGGCDLALLSAIIHQNSPDQNVALFEKAFRALEPGGALLIRDHVMDESRLSPAPGALFAVNMLANTHGGDTYTFSEIRSALEKAGFVEVTLLRKGERMDCLVEAVKP
jgi:SAM-dependent methyltransferase